MKTVNFKFVLDQMVDTPLGETGIVSMLGVDGEGVKCYVHTPNNGTWWKEKQLKASKSLEPKSSKIVAAGIKPKVTKSSVK